jgi:hypothetical protein
MIEEHDPHVNALGVKGVGEIGVTGSAGAVANAVWHVPNPDHALSPGMYCRVELKIPRKTLSLIVPSEAIIFNRNGLSVAVVENDTARVRNVTVVRDFGTSVEVSEGVAAGDRVILNPQVDLADGRKVTIRPDQPKPDQTKKS